MPMGICMRPDIACPGYIICCPLKFCYGIIGMP